MEDYMSNETKLDKLEDSGVFLFVYSDRFNIYFIFQHKEDNKLFKITTDKDINIEHIDEITNPDGFMNYKNIKFFKPFNKNDMLNFVGIVTFEDRCCRFIIENDVVKYQDDVEFEPVTQFNLLDCMVGVKIESYIQKKNKIYIVGESTNNHGDVDTIYGVADLVSGEFDVVYYLYSDKGSINLKTINIDSEASKVYVAGSLNQKPYYETFQFKS